MFLIHSNVAYVNSRHAHADLRCRKADDKISGGMMEYTKSDARWNRKIFRSLQGLRCMIRRTVDSSREMGAYS